MIYKPELIREYAKTNGVTMTYARSIIDSVFDLVMKKVFFEGEELNIRNIATFKHRIKKSHTIRHPVTGEPMTVPEKDTIVLIPSECLLNMDESSEIAADNIVEKEEGEEEWDGTRFTIK